MATKKYGKGPDAKPYAYHLGAVAAIAVPYGELAEVVAWLHDVIEDTTTTEDEVRAQFGDPFARFVAYLTKAAYRPGLCDEIWSGIDGIIGPLEAVQKAVSKLASPDGPAFLRRRAPHHDGVLVDGRVVGEVRLG